MDCALAHRRLILLLALSLGCSTVPESAAECAQPNDMTQPIGFSLSVALDYQSGTLDAFAPLCPENPKKQILTTSGDATLARWSSGIVVINRGASSYLQFVDQDFSLAYEIGINECNAHDLLELNTEEFLVTCYDSKYLHYLNLNEANANPWLDLGNFADEDGIPEMDRMLLKDQTAYISIQMLDRNQNYKAERPGKVIAFDISNFDPSLPPTQEALTTYDLPCWNPYTRMQLYQDTMLMVGCSGNWSTKETMGVITIDLENGESSTLYSGADLKGPVHSLYVAPNNDISVLTSVVGQDIWDIKEMVVWQLGENASALYQTSGFNLYGLSGYQELLFFGNREQNANAGLWTFDKESQEANGPFKTTLPPHDIMILTP